MSYDCPEKFNKQNNIQKATSYAATVNNVAVEIVQEGLEIMTGTFSINSIPAIVLFDFGASHTFISQAFVRVHSIPLAMKTPMLVNSPGGTILVSYCCPSANLSLRGVDFPISPMVMRTSGIDVILGFVTPKFKDKFEYNNLMRAPGIVAHTSRQITNVS